MGNTYIIIVPSQADEAAFLATRSRGPRPQADTPLHYGNAAGRSRDECVDILNHHGHNLT